MTGWDVPGALVVSLQGSPPDLLAHEGRKTTILQSPVEERVLSSDLWAPSREISSEEMVGFCLDALPNH